MSTFTSPTDRAWLASYRYSVDTKPVPWGVSDILHLSQFSNIVLDNLLGHQPTHWWLEALPLMGILISNFSLMVGGGRKLSIERIDGFKIIPV